MIWYDSLAHLNECLPLLNLDLPPRKQNCIKDFSEQIDSLLSYSLFSQWDANIQAWLATKLHECKVEIYNNRLLDCNNKFKDILASEHCAWKEYEETLYDVCDKIVCREICWVWSTSGVWRFFHRKL